MAIDWNAAMIAAHDNQNSEGPIGALANAYIKLHAQFVSAPMTLTKRETEILRFVADFKTDNGFAPTLEEISKAFGLKSLATVQEMLGNLQRKRWIIREHNRVRGIVIVHWPHGGEQ